MLKYVNINQWVKSGLEFRWIVAMLKRCIYNYKKLCIYKFTQQQMDHRCLQRQNWRLQEVFVARFCRVGEDHGPSVDSAPPRRDSLSADSTTGFSLRHPAPSPPPPLAPPPPPLSPATFLSEFLVFPFTSHNKINYFYTWLHRDQIYTLVNILLYLCEFW